MPEILIRCPITGRDVHTGIALAADVFLHTEFETHPVACPYCGARHSWSKKDAYMQFPPERTPSASRKEPH